MNFGYAEVKEQSVLDELKKVKNIVCVNSILDDVPNDVIVLGRIECDEKTTLSLTDNSISNLKVSDDKRIIIIVPEPELEQEQEAEQKE